MSNFDVDEMVIWTSPRTKERISMSFRGNTGLSFACLYNLKTGMQVIAPLSEVEHDWQKMCESEETKHAQTRTELAYVAQERNEYLDRAEAAEARAAELERQRDRAAYEATMTAARVVYDLAVKSKIDGRIDDYSAQIMAFNAICLSSGIR